MNSSAVITAIAPCVGDVGLEWKGRWGWWSKDGVLLIAACVGVFEVTVMVPGAIESAALDAVLRELQDLLQAELPSNAVLALVHWAQPQGWQPQSSRNRALRVAMLCDLGVLDLLRAAWCRGRSLCGGGFVARWRESFDAACGEGQRKRLAELLKAGPRHCGVVLELPSRWFAREVRQAEHVKLAPNSHWWEFAALFGRVAEAELCVAQGASTGLVWLLVQFVAPEGALCMYEGLADRYMYNQSNKHVDDCVPMTIHVGDPAALRERCRRSRASDGGGTFDVQFLLSRCGREIPIVGAFGKAPDQVQVSTSKRKLVIGREENCDIVLRHPHVSKCHGTLVLQDVGGASWVLMLQDSSSNGTWLNGSRMKQGQFQQIGPRDRLSFLPPGPDLDKDPLTFEVLAAGDSASKLGTEPSRATPPLAGMPLASDVVRTRSRSRSPRDQAAQGGAPTVQAQNVPEETEEVPTAVLFEPTAVLEPPTAVLDQPIDDDEEEEEEEEDEASLRMRLLETASTREPDCTTDSIGSVSTQQKPDHTTDNIGTWLYSLGLSVYESTLAGTYEHVSQIIALYSNSVSDFFEDIEIEDQAHQRIFEAAIRARVAP